MRKTVFVRPTARTIALFAMFVALQVVLSKFLMLQLSGSIRLSVDSVPILLSGLWFGPLAGALVGLMGDAIGTLLFPTAGAYYPPLTLAYILIGLIAGALGRLLCAKKRGVRISVSVAAAEIIGSLLYKTFALSRLFEAPFSVMLASRLLPCAVVLIADALLVFALDVSLGARVTQSPAREQALPSDEERSMSYDEALAYIHSVTWRGSRLGLERTRELLDRIGNPQNDLKFIHVAGTNGKGSTCAMLASVLQKAGYRTGLYTSPFINRFNERIAINGAPIPDETLAAVTAYVRPFADDMADHPTEFELITCIALEYYRREKVDIVVLEVGMGGELDSTNVIDTPVLAIITNIGLDHTRELGPTITDIARAKAGVIKRGGDVLIYGLNGEADAVFSTVCEEKGARLHETDHTRLRNVSYSLDALTFDFAPYVGLSCPLIGSYQTRNAAVAITAIELLRQKGYAISDAALFDGLKAVRWPARFEILAREPLFIADGGHNPQGIHAVMESIEAHFPNRKLVFLLGVMADKDVSHMIDQIGPHAKAFVTVTPHNPRAMDAKQLCEALVRLGCRAVAAESVPDGVRLARETAGKDGIVCALGSLYLLGDVRSALNVR